MIVVLAVRQAPDLGVPPALTGVRRAEGTWARSDAGVRFGGNLLLADLVLDHAGYLRVAFGYHLSLVNLMAIDVLVSFFAGLMPVPGGVGVTQAPHHRLVAAGVPQAAALSAVLVYRTYPSPPPTWGYFTMRWLERNDYL